MSQKDKQTIEEDSIDDQADIELDRVANEDGTINEEKIKEEAKEKDKTEKNKKEKEKTIETLAKVTADFDNFKKRTERNKEDMIFFLKSDILKKILPRIDDMERILKNTPEDMRENPLYEGIVSMQKKLLSDLNKMGVVPFDSIGEEVNPDFHDVMTTLPNEESKDLIIDEFEKGYTLNDKILRHAKVVVGV